MKMGLVIVSLLVFASIASVAGVAYATDMDIENNGAITQAPYITFGSYNGTLKITSASDTTDFYRVNLTKFEVIFVNFTNAPLGSDMSITSNYGTSMVTVTGTSAQLEYCFDTAITAGIKISSTNAGGYNFTLEHLVQNDAGSGGDAHSVDSNLDPIVTQGTYSGYMCADDDADWYRVTVPKNKFIYVNATPNADMRIDATLKRLADVRCADASTGLGDAVALWDFTDAEQEYTFGFTMSEGHGAYNFTVVFGDQNDAGAGRDAGEEFLDSVWLDNGTYQGQFVGYDYDDWYCINLSDGDAITVTAKPGAASKISVELRNHIGAGNDALVGSAVSEFAGSNVTVHYCFNGATQAQIRFSYLASYGVIDFYNFTITTMKQDDAGSGTDASETGGAAITIDNGTFSAYMEDADNIDIFKFTAPAGGTINVSISSPTNMNIDVNLRNQSWGVVGTASVSGNNGTILFLNDAARQDFYLEVRLGTITTEPSSYFYSFTLNLTAGDLIPPSASMAALPAQSCTNFTVSWSSPDIDVKWFDVQVRYGTLDWTDWMVNATNRTAEYTGVISTKYFFRVRAMDTSNNWCAYTTDPEGNVNTTVTQSCTGSTDTTRPTISISNPSNGATISTSETSVQCIASDDVGVMKVEVRVGAGAWVNCTQVGGYWTASVTLAQGVNTITARATDAAGNYAEDSSTVTMSNTPPNAVTLNQATAISQTRFTISWTQNTNDDFASYQVYVSMTQGFTPDISNLKTTISTRTTTNTTIASLSPGKTYYIKVRVLDSGSLYADSNEVTAKTKAAATNTSCCGFALVPLMIIPCIAIVFSRRGRRE